VLSYDTSCRNTTRFLSIDRLCVRVCAANNPAVTTGAEMWPGVAGVVQSTLVLGSGLLMWVSRAPQYSVYGF
jgi:hypothetical protein